MFNQKHIFKKAVTVTFSKRLANVSRKQKWNIFWVETAERPSEQRKGNGSFPLNLYKPEEPNE
jgi:hypothetical protein